MKIKNIIKGIMILVVMILLVSASSAYASGQDWLNDLANNTNTAGGNEIEQENTTPEQNTNPPLNTLPNTAPNAVNTTGPENLPEAGLSNPVFIIIAICAVAALYAYKKIRDYKLK